MDGKLISKEYENYLLASGMRTKGIRHSMSIYRRYLNETGLDILTADYRDAQNFQGYLVSQKDRYQTSSILSIIGPLSAFYDYAQKRRITAANPFRLIDRVKSPHRIPGNIPDEAEMDALLIHMARFTRGTNLTEFKSAYKAHVLTELLYSTGMRISEAA
ncbi:MAG: hypothetical protein KAR21_23920, partial [Spirochaetales bacterium]|nr:hypothetical protein [Spirochaetales bacterium]